MIGLGIVLIADYGWNGYYGWGRPGYIAQRGHTGTLQYYDRSNYGGRREDAHQPTLLHLLITEKEITLQVI